MNGSGKYEVRIVPTLKFDKYSFNHKPSFFITVKGSCGWLMVRDLSRNLRTSYREKTRSILGV